MCEFLVDMKEPSATQPQRMKGAVVAVLDDGHHLARGGIKEVPPEFVWIKAPGLDRVAHAHMAGGLIFSLAQERTADDAATDLSELRTFNENTCSVAAPEQDWAPALTGLLTLWGQGSVVQGAEAFTHESDGDTVGRSAAIWGTGPVSHTTMSYDPARRVRRVRADYRQALDAELDTKTETVQARMRRGTRAKAQTFLRERTHRRMMRRPEALGGVVETFNRAARVIEVSLDHIRLQHEMLVQMKDLVDFQYAKRRYLFSPALVDAAAVTGEAEVTDLGELTDRASV